MATGESGSILKGSGGLSRCTSLDLARASEIEAIVQSTPHTVAQSSLHLDNDVGPGPIEWVAGGASSTSETIEPAVASH